MIEKFVSDDNVIRLRNRGASNQPAIPEENIFSVDSFSLIIGDNGSGKTRTLDAIIDSMCNHGEENWSLDWTPVFFDDALSTNADYGVVFFSQAPNRRPKTRRNRNYIDASISKRRSYPPESLLGHEELLRKVIRQDTRFEAELRADTRKPLRQCVELMLADHLETPPGWVEIRRDIADLSHHYQGLSGATTAAERRLRESGELIPVRGIDPEFDRHLDHVAFNLREKIFSKLGRIRALAFFIALDCLLRMVEHPQELLLSAFRIMLRFRVTKAGYNGVPDIPELKRYYDVVLRLFEGIENRPDFKIADGPILKVTFDVATQYDAEELRRRPLDDIVKIGWRNVSSGQWALVTQCIEIDRAVKVLSKRGKGVKSILVLIDEGDAFLHLEWQRQYVHVMDKLLAGLKRQYGPHCLQVIVATHSPLLATDVPGTYVNRLRDEQIVGQSVAFAAPMQTLLNNSFGAKSIGEHAAQTIREVIGNARRGTTPTARDIYVASIVDDPIIKRELEGLLKLRREDQL